MSSQLRYFMRRQPHWRLSACVPLVTAGLWLWHGWNASFAWALAVSAPASVLGVGLLAIGVAVLFWPGQRMVFYYWALLSLASIVLAATAGWLFGWPAYASLLISSLLNPWAVGAALLSTTVQPVALPKIAPSLRLMFKAFLDAVLLARFLSGAKIPRGRAAEKDYTELARLRSLINGYQWHEQPQQLLPQPKVPQNIRTQTRHTRGMTYQLMSFPSDYTPKAWLPGLEEWQGIKTNKTAYARVFRHDGSPRPWLVCLHGYQMGTPAADFSLFHVKHLHKTLGLNVLMPILPLHGVRKIGRVSGSRYLDGSLLQTFHALAQSQQDIRQCLGWLRQYAGEQKVGMLGHSLGGYHAALLATIEQDLACVIAGMPLTDLPSVLWRHMPAFDREYFESLGINLPWLDKIMAPVSPLWQKPVVAAQRRYILAGVADQIVPPEQALALWQHWQQPTVMWYQGTHLSARGEKQIQPFVDKALAESGLITAAS